MSDGQMFDYLSREELDKRCKLALEIEREWETTLGRLSGGEYDSVGGLERFVAKTRAAREREEFIDSAAIRVVSGLGDPESSARFAREAYDLAEALWEERKRRRNAR
jgi:hypothetical protein